jgi:hypothetical protein
MFLKIFLTIEILSDYFPGNRNNIDQKPENLILTSLPKPLKDSNILKFKEVPSTTLGIRRYKVLLNTNVSKTAFDTLPGLRNLNSYSMLYKQLV